jgi:radical SAM protein with 4Fe4S-binding SPASM domain
MKSKGLNVLMDTNAVLLNKDVAKELLDSGLDFISISFDGYEADTYEKIRVNAKFDITLENIKTFLKLKKENNYKTFVRIRSIEDAGEGFSVEKREIFRALFKDLPINDFVTPTLGNWNQDFPDNEIFQIPKPSEINIHHPYYHPCPHLWTSLCIRWNGIVIPCCMDLLNQMEMGDMKIKKLLEIWNDNPMLELREKHIKGHLTSPCITCDYMISKSIMGLPTRGFSGITTIVRKYLGIESYKNIFGQNSYLRRSF